MTLRLLILVFLSFPAVVSASPRQEFLNAHAPFFRVFHSKSDDAQLSAFYSPEVDETAGVGSYDLERYGFSTELPLALSRDAYLRYGFDYTYSSYSLKDNPTARLNNTKENLHQVGLSLGFGRFLTDRVLLTGIFKPGLYSDFDEDLVVDDLRYFGDLMLVGEVNPGAQLFFGLRRDELFDDLEFYPVFGVKLLGSNGQIYVDVSIPTHLLFKYNFNRKSQFYLGVWTEAQEYNTTNNLNGEQLEIRTRENKIGLGVKFWPTSWLSVGAEVGGLIESEFEFKAIVPGQFRGDLDDAYYVGAFIGTSF